MEENKEQIVENVEETIEILVPSYNIHDKYIPTTFSIEDMKKYCHCGRSVFMLDNYCPTCGQRIGIPEQFYEERSK